MVSVMCNWIDIAGITWIMGFCLVRGLKKIAGADGAKDDMVSYSFYGLMVATVYAQIWSIFGKVAGTAHAILLLTCITGLTVCFYFDGKHKDLMEPVKSMTWKAALQELAVRGKTKGNARLKVSVVAVLILLFAYGTSRGYIHYDTSLYHAQSIRWIEEYGMVKGLGNLQSRFAYNSAAFPLSALFSMKWLTGVSLHTVPGYMALLLTLECLRPVLDKRFRHQIDANLVRVCALLYVLSIYTEMISPASDYFTVLAIFYILIKWLSVKGKCVHSYAMLCLLTLWTVTMKLSAVPLLLLTLHPLWLLTQDKDLRKIGIYTLSGILIFSPYVIRNYFLSGWLIYPLPGIDLFQVPWKVPASMALYDYQEIAVFARGTGVENFGSPLMSWLPAWFQRQTSFYKLFLLAAVAAALVWCMICLRTLMGRKDGKAERTMVSSQWLFVTAVFMTALIFWFVSSPSIRFGVAFLLSFPVLVFGQLYQLVTDRMKLLCGICGLLLVYRLGTCLQSCGYYAKNDFWIWQKPYDDFAVETYQVDGEDIYYPSSGDRVGYAAFPASERQREDIGLLDKRSIKGGFFYISQDGK